jgi:hypothetical protein
MTRRNALLPSSLFASSGGDASEDYEDCIGARKHLVLGLLSQTGAPHSSNFG